MARQGVMVIHEFNDAVYPIGVECTDHLLYLK